MASFADQLISGAQAQTKEFGDDVSEAAGLAQKVQNIQANRQKLEQSKSSHRFKTLEQSAKALDRVEKADSPEKAKFLARGTAAALRQSFPNLDPDFEQLLLKDRKVAQQTKIAIQSILSKADGQIDPAANEKINQLMEQGGGELLDTVEQFNIQERKDVAAQGRAEALAQAQAQRQQTGITAKKAAVTEKRKALPQETVDKTFAKDVAKFRSTGGEKEIEKNIGELESAIKDLLGPEELASRFVIGLLPDAVTDIKNPELAAVRDKIRGAIQATLRQTLGAQFTEREGRAIFERAFNPKLSDKENIRRTRAVLKSLKSQSRDKIAAIKHFEKEGTLAGFSPSTPAGLAKEKRTQIVTAVKNLKGKNSREQVEATLLKKNISQDQATKILDEAGF